MMDDVVMSNTLLRTLNHKRVFRLLYNEGSLTQADIKEKSGLSGPTVAQCIQSFRQSGVFIDGEELASSGGRKPRMIAFNYDYRYSVGLEIRKHHVDICILNLKGDVIYFESFRLNFELNEEYLDSVNTLVEKVIKEHVDREMVLGIGIAFPGEVSLDRQMITRSTLLNIRQSVSLASIQKHFDLPLILEYGPNAAAFGSTFINDNQNDLIYIVITNDGLGGSVIYDNKIYRGKNGKAAAFGHFAIRSNKDNSIQSWSYLCAITTLTQDEDGDYKSFFKDIDTNKEKQNRLNDYLTYMAQGIASVKHAYDADIVIGGKIVPYLQPYLNQIKEYVFEFKSIDENDNFNISLDAHTSSPMAYGAALMIISQYFDKEEEQI